MSKILIDEATVKLALKALNTTESDCGSRAWEREIEAITSLWEALADQRAQQEPIAEQQEFSCKVCSNKPDSEGVLEHGSGCYVMQPEGGGSEFIADAIPQPAQPYKGLADHTNQVTNGRMRIDPVTGDVSIGTPFSQPAQQEPVAWVCEHELPLAPGESFSWVETFVHKTPLYTTPQPAQRTWVGLTEGEKDECVDAADEAAINKPLIFWSDHHYDAIEAKLKEKNT